MNKFLQIENYEADSHGYRLLPFRFTALDAGRYVLTNIAGEFLTLPSEVVHKLINHDLQNDHPAFVELRSKHFLIDGSGEIAKDLLTIKVRSRYARLADFTSLHMFVVTLRCEHSCRYCQVSRQSEDRVKFDMSVDDAMAALDLVFKSPAPAIKIEFQGGEPLLNFPLIRQIVEAVEKRSTGKSVAFVIATNLALIDREILEFCRKHDVSISTSLDGPEALHNANRRRPGQNSYAKTIEGIKLARYFLGKDKVSALMTTTLASLNQVIPIVDEYLAQEFAGIFLRPLSPYGFAIRTKSYSTYNVDRWIEFYKEGLDYIISLNRQGVRFTEYFAATILKKMFTSQDPGYIDLMSPSGVGIAGVIYNYDGSVYASDEGRMLAEMGDDHFRLGNVHQSYKDTFLSPRLLEALEQSFAESAPMCSDCAFVPYCGADPVLHWGLYKDYLGRKPESEFCRRNMAVFRYLIAKMEDDPVVRRLFIRWATQC